MTQGLKNAVRTTTGTRAIGEKAQSALIFLFWPALVALAGTLIFFPANVHPEAYASGSWLLVFAVVDVVLMGLLAAGIGLSLRRSGKPRRDH